ncbi:MAG: TRAP transporter small permease [Arenicella sp.]
MQTFREYFYLTSGYLSGLCIIGITGLIMAQIIGRFFGVLVPSVEDFSGYCLSASIFFGLAYTFREGGHIRVSLLIRRLSPGKRRIQETFNLILALFLVGFMAFYCCHMVWESHHFNDVSDGYIPVPLWLPQLPVALGSVALLIAIFDDLVRVISGKQPSYIEHEDELNLEEI